MTQSASTARRKHSAAIAFLAVTATWILAALFKLRVTPIDTDHNGMSDDREIAVGLDPSDPVDGNLDRNSDEHANLEESIHSEERL